MRSRTSRGVPEGSGGKDLYIGSCQTDTGMFRVISVMYRDHREGPGTLPIAPETFPMTKTGLPIYKSLPPDRYETPRDVWDLI